MHNAYVTLPPNETPLHILMEPKMRLFGDCLDALNGTHIPIYIEAKDKPGLYRNRK